MYALHSWFINPIFQLQSQALTQSKYVRSCRCRASRTTSSVSVPEKNNSQIDSTNSWADFLRLQS